MASTGRIWRPCWRRLGAKPNTSLNQDDAVNAMKKVDPAVFHKLYGIKKTRIAYHRRDFLDYLLMIFLSAIAIGLSYGFDHIMSIVGLALCAFTLAAFIVRHGVEFRVPLILKRPQDVLYMFVYKLQNLRPMYFITIGLLLLENVLIAATPNLPHHVELARTIAFYLFYAHFISITAYRTAILVDHLAKKELVREVLMQTPWKRAVNEKTNITLEIAHAYCTGLLTHIILIAPWYLVISYFSFSAIFLPLVCLINVIVHWKWIIVYNAWFYRDHWVGHNSELEFIYIHGPHHDAIPSGMIAVSGNGFLEGITRYTLGAPTAFYNPVISFMINMAEVAVDIKRHQYIPGVFPRLSKSFLEVFQHSIHHYGLLEPYSIGLKTDKMYTIWLDEKLTGFKWDNPIQRKILSLYDKYQK